MAHTTLRRHAAFRKSMSLAARKRGGKGLPEALSDFIASGRLAGDEVLATDLDNMPTHTAALTRAAVEAIVSDLQRMPSMREPATAWKNGPKEIDILVGRASQILLALRLSGEDEITTSYVEGVIARLIEESAWICEISKEAAAAKITPGELAASALAAATMERPVPIASSSFEAIGMLGPEQASPLSHKELAKAADRLRAALRAADASVTQRLAAASQAQRTALGLSLPRLTGTLTEWIADRPIHTDAFSSARAEGPETIDIKALVGFLASGRGNTDEAKLEGTIELLRAMSLLTSEIIGHGSTPAQPVVMQRTLISLGRLSSTLKEERAAHRKTEQMWLALDAQLHRMPQKEGQMRVLPLPRLEALDSRALYYHNAIMNGLPLGIVLAEIYDSDEMSFGPTERTYFERVAMWAARKYSSNTASFSSDMFEDMDIDPSLIEHVRAACRKVEVKLRRNSTLSDADLGKMARDGLSNLQGVEIAASDTRKLVAKGNGGNNGLVDEMILKARAEEEVRLITAHTTIKNGLDGEIVSCLKELPHVRSFATRDEDGRFFWNRFARNGQTMFELERDTRSRWIRHRQEAAANRDVRPVRIPGAEEIPTYSPLSLRAAAPKKDQQMNRPPIDDDELVARPRTR